MDIQDRLRHISDPLRMQTGDQSFPAHVHTVEICLKRSSNGESSSAQIQGLGFFSRGIFFISFATGDAIIKTKKKKPSASIKSL